MSCIQTTVASTIHRHQIKLFYGLSFIEGVLNILGLEFWPPFVNFDIVWLARGCVERGDLEQAVKYMTLLRGEPKNVAREWVREARLLLEARQVCDALMAHAAAYGLEAFPTK